MGHGARGWRAKKAAGRAELREQKRVAVRGSGARLKRSIHMSALAQAAAIERGVGLLPLQIRRHQEELRRWRQLENHAPSAHPRSGSNSGTRNVAAVQRARAAAAAPRQESQELQALVIERRELLARQKSQSREHNLRVLQAARALQPAEAEPAYSSGEDLATGGQVADSFVSFGEEDFEGRSISLAAPRQRSPARRGDGSRQALELQEKMQQLQVEQQAEKCRLGSAIAHCPGLLGWTPACTNHLGRAAEPLTAQLEATMRP